MPGMHAFATDSNQWLNQKIVEYCCPEAEFDVLKERYRCRKLGESFSRKVHSLRDWGSEKQHPWLLMLLLPAAHTIHYILVGIENLPLILIIIAVPASWGLVIVGSLFYVSRLDGRDQVISEGRFTTEVLHRMGVFVICTVLFALFKQFCSFLCRWTMDPLSLLIDKADEIFVPFGFIICFALLVFRNSYVSLLSMALSFAYLYVLTYLRVISVHIPWVVLVPLTGLLFIFLIAFLRHICTCISSGSTRSDCQDVNSNGELQNPEDSKPQESQASEPM